MRRQSAAALAIALSLSLLSSLPAYARRRAVTPRAPAPASSPYLTEAMAAAEWLTSLERVRGTDALAWPTVEGNTGTSSGIDSGAAGIGAYFLKLYQSTGDARFFDKAERAARFVISEYRANRFNGHDFLAGAAGTGDFLLELYTSTQKAEFLDGARLAGEFLLGNAIVDGDGLYWKHHPQHPNTYTGLAHGTAGVGIFLIRLHDATQDARYLDAAERGYHWMKAYQVNLSGATPAISWKRLVVDAHGYTGWCGGAAGTVTFLDELHRATGKAEYLDAWRATVEGLYVSAIRTRQSPEEYAWMRYTNGGEGRSYPVIYCHGTAGNVVIVAEAAARTGDARYAEVTAGAGRWLDHVAIRGTQGLLWEHFAPGNLRERGLLTGTAAVGHASLRLYAATNDEAHLQRAIKAAEYLMAVADHPRPGQTRWHDRADNSEPPAYRTGWYTGGAGVGIFLVELHDTLRGKPLSSRFSALNP
jgi:uncharacterized protein YyaL (SSP411 family)